MIRENELLITERIKILGYDKVIQDLVIQIEMSKESLFYIERKKKLLKQKI